MDQMYTELMHQAREMESRAWIQTYAGKYNAAHALFMRAHGLWVRVANFTGLVRAIRVDVAIAKTLQWQGEFGAAQQILERALLTAHDGEIDSVLDLILVSLADIALDAQDYSFARKLLEETLPRSVRDPIFVAGQLELLALAYFGEDDPIRAVTLFSSARAAQDKISVGRTIPVLVIRRQQFQTAAQQLIGKTEYEKRWNQGERMTLTDTLSYALSC